MKSKKYHFIKDDALIEQIQDTCNLIMSNRIDKNSINLYYQFGNDTDNVFYFGYSDLYEIYF